MNALNLARVQLDIRFVEWKTCWDAYLHKESSQVDSIEHASHYYVWNK